MYQTQVGKSDRPVQEPNTDASHENKTCRLVRDDGAQNTPAAIELQETRCLLGSGLTYLLSIPFSDACSRHVNRR